MNRPLIHSLMLDEEDITAKIDSFPTPIGRTYWLHMAKSEEFNGVNLFATKQQLMAMYGALELWATGMALTGETIASVPCNTYQPLANGDPMKT